MAATGSYLGFICYPDADAARSMHCASAYPTQGVSDGDLVTFSCSGVDPGVGLVVVRTASAASEAASSVVGTSYSACVPGAIDSTVITPELAGQAFAWAFCLVMLVYFVSWSAQQVLDVIEGRRGG